MLSRVKRRGHTSQHVCWKSLDSAGLFWPLSKWRSASNASAKKAAVSYFYTWPCQFTGSPDSHPFKIESGSSHKHALSLLTFKNGEPLRVPPWWNKCLPSQKWHHNTCTNKICEYTEKVLKKSILQKLTFWHGCKFWELQLGCDLFYWSWGSSTHVWIKSWKYKSIDICLPLLSKSSKYQGKNNKTNTMDWMASVLQGQDFLSEEQGWALHKNTVQ